MKWKFEDIKISLIGGLILAMLTLLSGYLVYQVMQQQSKSMLERSLESSLQNNQSFFAGQINRNISDTLAITSRPFTIRNIELLEKQPGNVEARRELELIAQSLLQIGYSAAAVYDSHGNLVARAGSFVQNPEISVPLNTPLESSLLWEWEFMLHANADVKNKQGRRIGSIATEIHMPQLDGVVGEAKVLGTSAELAVCAPLEMDMQCFPLTIARGVTPRLSRTLGGKPLPMSYALEGKSGMVYTQDYRNEMVVAAYSPVGSLGLGMVLKIDQAELKKSMNAQLKIVVPLLVSLVAGGILLLNWLVTPLVRKMVMSEREVREANERLRESETRLQVMLDSSEVGIAWANTDGVIEYANPKFVKMFGYTLEDVPTVEQWYLHAFPDPAERDKVVTLWNAEVEASRQNKLAMPPMEQTIHCKDGRLVHTILAGSWAGSHLLATFTDITAQKKAEETIQHQANFDPLTQLPNRRLFHDRLLQEIKKSHRSGLPVALLFIDIDRFKEVNDSLGHDMGDMLLIEAARRLLSCVRETDTVARMGGDEFTVILGELEDDGDVERVTQNILRKLADPFQLQDEIVYVSGSIGITLYPADTTEVDVLLKNADQAMYAAKSQGRDRCHYFTSAMQEAALMRARITSDLRNAMVGNQFVVYYQPVVELETGLIRKAEALIRWQHPLLGRVNPVEFIAIAEETGMIIEIGNWVFREAARQALLWRESIHEDFQISVNKSPVQFHAGDGKHETWIDFLHKIGLPGKNIVVEITEGLLLKTDSSVTDKLLAFSQEGIQVSLDDFGTGYSSLTYLKKLDIDNLKIDQSFVHNLAPGSDDMALCEAIIVMAHKLGLKVIAEGIETQQQSNLLRAAGCDYGQGFLFSRPVSAQQFEALIVENGGRA